MVSAAANRVSAADLTAAQQAMASAGAPDVEQLVSQATADVCGGGTRSAGAPASSGGSLWGGSSSAAPRELGSVMTARNCSSIGPVLGAPRDAVAASDNGRPPAARERLAARTQGPARVPILNYYYVKVVAITTQGGVRLPE